MLVSSTDPLLHIYKGLHGPGLDFSKTIHYSPLWLPLGKNEALFQVVGGDMRFGKTIKKAQWRKAKQLQ